MLLTTEILDPNLLDLNLFLLRYLYLVEQFLLAKKVVSTELYKESAIEVLKNLLLIECKIFSKKLILVNNKKCLYIEFVRIIILSKMIIEFHEILEFSMCKIESKTIFELYLVFLLLNLKILLSLFSMKL
jgi:hypothetical protein